MSLPKAVFLDTSIFAGQQYNFGSTAFSSFVPAAKQKGLRLLLPDPTEREIRRQIKVRSDEALKALDDARRKAPFLAKWRHWPHKPANSDRDWEVRHIALGEWAEFLKQLEVTKLKYDGISIDTVMNWYDEVEAPFGEGKKRKEFPDAFAIAALSAHASKTDSYVAVVSEDPDFKAACERFPSLLYFPSLPRITEFLLLDDKDNDWVRDTVIRDSEKIQESALDAAQYLTFYHSSENLQLEDSSVRSVSISDIRVVGIGDGECTIVFEATLNGRFSVSWSEWGDPDEDEHHTVREYFYESPGVSGTAKLKVNKTTRSITEVTIIDLGDSEVEISSRPGRYHDEY